MGSKLGEVMKLGRRKVVAAAGAATLARLPTARAEAATSAFFSVNGVRIHYLVKGGGSPVVLIHGRDSSAERTWETPGTMAALARTHRVLAIDLPGYGSSDKPTTPEAYGVQWSEDVLRLLDYLAIQKAHIVGYSMGGIVTLKFAVDHHDRMLTGTLVGMGLLEQGGAEQRSWAQRPDQASRRVAELALTPEQLKTVLLPMQILVGSNDPARWSIIESLLAVRRDWPVVEIADADHVSCLLKNQFKDELIRWLDGGR
jgi:pimeloyl-ACP methyl ester carboxylesterase